MAHFINNDDPATVSVAADPDSGPIDEAPSSVLVQIEHAALNYRDFIVASGRFGAVPQGFVAGNEGAGIVVASTAAAFRQGDRVFVNGHGLGERRPGTLSGQITIPPEAATPLPDTMTTRQAAIVGVASLVSYAADQLLPSGPVAVTGAMGGTGRVAAACFARMGRDVTALTRAPDQAGVLAELGIIDIIAPPSEAERASNHFGPERFAAAFDVTAVCLNWLTRQMCMGGTMALAGFAGSLRPDVNALAVILRGLRLAGVNAGLPVAQKAKALQWAVGILRADDYDRLAHPAPLSEVAPLLRDFAAKRGRGRILVSLP